MSHNFPCSPQGRGIALYYGDTNLQFPCTFRRSACDLQYLIQILTRLAVKKYGFYKLNAAARLTH